MNNANKQQSYTNKWRKLNSALYKSVLIDFKLEEYAQLQYIIDHLDIQKKEEFQKRNPSSKEKFATSSFIKFLIQEYIDSYNNNPENQTNIPPASDFIDDEILEIKHIVEIQKARDKRKRYKKSKKYDPVTDYIYYYPECEYTADDDDIPPYDGETLKKISQEYN